MGSDVIHLKASLRSLCAKKDSVVHYYHPVLYFHCFVFVNFA